MSTATTGRAREHRTRDALIAKGWEPIFRAAGSKGPADIGMAHEDHGLALIQVGTAGKNLGPDARARLCRAAWLCSALPILARHIASPGKPTVIEWWVVNAGTPSKWERWTP